MSGVAHVDVVRDAREVAALEREPLLVLEPLEAFLDAAGLGAGPVDAVPIGDGHSNVTYMLRRGELRLVLRRPPRGPLPPSAHDVLREARLLTALGRLGARVPEILATCADDGVIGAPFYVMPFIDGHVLTRRLPPALGGGGGPDQIADELVDTLVELHSIDASLLDVPGFAPRDGYLERQLRRFRGLLEVTATRPLPELERIADWLEAELPGSAEIALVHGDYRLGNVMFAPGAPTRLAVVLDWELAAVGDPLADVGYMTIMWADPGDRANPMLDLSAVTRLPGFPRRAALAERYAAATGRDLGSLAWYQVLALWKSAIFLEGSYQRYLAGTTADGYFASLEIGVPAVARLAAERIAAA